MTRFRDPVARDQAWGRYFAKRGLRPIQSEPRSIPNEYRLADYTVRRARHDAALVLSRALVRC